MSRMTTQARTCDPGRRPVVTVPGPRPNGCQCSWGWSNGREYLKYLSGACTVHIGLETLPG